jgi:hypothetical protein
LRLFRICHRVLGEARRHLVRRRLAAVFPLRSSANIVDQKPHSLIVGGIQPQHAPENLLGFLEPAQAPKTQPKSIHAAEKWGVVDPPPGKQTIEAFTKDNSPILNPTS